MRPCTDSNMTDIYQSYSNGSAGRRRKQRVGEEGQRGRAEDAGLGRGDPAPSPAEGRGRPAAPGPACLGIPIAGSIINPPGSAGAGRQLPWLFGFSLLGAFQAPAGKQWPSRHASPAKGQDAEGRARPQRPGVGLLSRHPADWQRRGGQIQKAGGWRRKACKPRTRYPANDSFKSERQMKNFPGKQNLLDLTYRECNGNKRL